MYYKNKIINDHTLEVKKNANNRSYIHHILNTKKGERDNKSEPYKNNEREVHILTMLFQTNRFTHKRAQFLYGTLSKKPVLVLQYISLGSLKFFSS